MAGVDQIGRFVVERQRSRQVCDHIHAGRVLERIDIHEASRHRARAKFELESLPELRQRSGPELMAANGLGQHYCSLIRLGKRTPHPRHWDALRVLADHARA